jgi:hypothetical protein
VAPQLLRRALVVLDPDDRLLFFKARGKPGADHLGAELLGEVGDRGARVVGQFSRDYHGHTPVLLVDTNAAVQGRVVKAGVAMHDVVGEQQGLGGRSRSVIVIRFAPTASRCRQKGYSV